jgi:hypothetical protein
MPIRGLLDVKGAAFDPEDITVMTAAHGIVLEQLNVTDRKSATAFLIAKTVIEIAKIGERDPRVLSEKGDPGPSIAPVVKGADTVSKQLRNDGGLILKRASASRNLRRVE